MPRYKLTLLLTGMAVVAAVGLGTAIHCTVGFWRPGPLVDSAIFGDYEVRIYRRHENNLLERLCNDLPGPLSGIPGRIPGIGEWNGVEILYEGRRVYARYGVNIAIAEFSTNRVTGLDITGKGVPYLALTDECGRQGGGSFWLFECGKHFHEIFNIESVGHYPELKDLDDDGIPELVVSDDAFYHWPQCMDGAPEPEIILRWTNGKYTPAADLMFKPAPPEQSLQARAIQIRAGPGWNAETGSVPDALWTNAVALMYTGHEELAWGFVDMAWKPGFPKNGTSKAVLIAYWLEGRLNDSVYWPELHRQFKNMSRFGSKQGQPASGTRPRAISETGLR